MALLLCPRTRILPRQTPVETGIPRNTRSPLARSLAWKIINHDPFWKRNFVGGDRKRTEAQPYSAKRTHEVPGMRATDLTVWSPTRIEATVTQEEVTREIRRARERGRPPLASECA